MLMVGEAVHLWGQRYVENLCLYLPLNFAMTALQHESLLKKYWSFTTHTHKAERNYNIKNVKLMKNMKERNWLPGIK